MCIATRAKLSAQVNIMITVVLIYICSRSSNRDLITTMSWLMNPGNISPWNAFKVWWSDVKQAFEQKIEEHFHRHFFEYPNADAFVVEHTLLLGLNFFSLLLSINWAQHSSLVCSHCDEKMSPVKPRYSKDANSFTLN